MDVLMVVILTLLCVTLVGTFSLVVYAFLHAKKHGEERRLHFFLYGECVPQATPEERERWLRSM